VVAASCAAILAVYAAGYWRTRDEAGRFDNPSQARRPVRAARPSPVPPEVAAAPVVPAAAPAAARVIEPAPAAGKSRLPAESAPRQVVVPPPSSNVPPAEPVSPPASQEVLADATEQAPPEPSNSPWHDGTYTGWGLSRHGDIEARVTIKQGGIVAVGIATCATRYPCYVIDEILQQPLYRQSADVDTVSRATESADAYSDAVWQALQKAEAGPSATATASP